MIPKKSLNKTLIILLFYVRSDIIYQNMINGSEGCVTKHAQIKPRRT